MTPLALERAGYDLDDIPDEAYFGTPCCPECGSVHLYEGDTPASVVCGNCGWSGQSEELQ